MTQPIVDEIREAQRLRAQRFSDACTVDDDWRFMIEAAARNATQQTHRGTMVRIAALAMSAIEAFDRRVARPRKSKRAKRSA